MKYKITEDYIDRNKYSRPGNLRTKTVKSVVHWVANPGSTAKQNRNYFNKLSLQFQMDIMMVNDKVRKELKKTYKYRFASTQFIIDDDTTLQTMPMSEIAYHVGAKKYTKEAFKMFGRFAKMSWLTPNLASVGTEMCHPDWTGKFTLKSIDRLIDLQSEICIIYNLNPSTDIIRHFDVTGKICPKYYVKNELDWIDILHDIEIEYKIRKRHYDKVEKYNEVR